MTYKEKILDRINTLKSGDIFIANDFFDIAGYETIRSTLNRLVESKEITRIMNGIYFKSRYIGSLSSFGDSN